MLLRGLRVLYYLMVVKKVQVVEKGIVKCTTISLGNDSGIVCC